MWLWHKHVDMGGRARCQWVVEIYAFISWGSNYNWDHHWHWPTADLEGKSKEYFHCAPGHPISITIFQSHGLIKIKFWSSSRMWTKCQPRWSMPMPVHKNRWYSSIWPTPKMLMFQVLYLYMKILRNFIIVLCLNVLCRHDCKIFFGTLQLQRDASWEAFLHKTQSRN